LIHSEPARFQGHRHSRVECLSLRGVEREGRRIGRALVWNKSACLRRRCNKLSPQTEIGAPGRGQCTRRLPDAGCSADGIGWFEDYVEGEDDITAAAEGRSVLLTRTDQGDDNGSHDFCSCHRCRSFDLQPACGGCRRGSLVRRDQRWRVLGLPISFVGRLLA
jgi:hypothetical protein